MSVAKTKKKVFIPRADHDERILSGLREKGYDLDFFSGPGKCPRDEFLRRIKGVDAVLITPGSNENIDQQVMDAAGTKLKVIATFSVG